MTDIAWVDVALLYIFSTQMTDIVRVDVARLYIFSAHMTDIVWVDLARFNLVYLSCAVFVSVISHNVRSAEKKNLPRLDTWDED